MRVGRGVLRGAWPLVLLLIGCGQVVSRDADMTPGAEAPSESLRVVLPPGARCRGTTAPAVVQLSAESSQQRCEPASQVLAWSRLRPPGLCYELNAPCPGVPDHHAYLTFDDGPSDWTASILDTLANRGVRATFFVNARGLKGPRGLDGSYTSGAGMPIAYRDMLKRIVVDGHILGNHSLDHVNLGKLKATEIDSQLRENERLVNAALHQLGVETSPLTLLRPPFGSPWFEGDAPLTDPLASQLLAGPVFARHGYNVLWNISSTDADEWAIGESYNQVELNRMRWQSSVAYADKVARIRSTVLDHALVQAGKGIVVLMHDSHNATRDALADVIDRLRARGYRFATIEDQVQAQYGRSSLELTPGPALFQACGNERARSCAAQGSPSGAAVCGRFWEAFEAFGGEAALGDPLSPPTRSESGAMAQHFDHGTIELHPELPSPCDVVLLPEP